MPHNAMTPHISGSSLSAQVRIAAGARMLLERFLDGRELPEECALAGGTPSQARPALEVRSESHLLRCLRRKEPVWS